MYLLENAGAIFSTKQKQKLHLESILFVNSFWFNFPLKVIVQGLPGHMLAPLVVTVSVPSSKNGGEWLSGVVPCHYLARHGEHLSRQLTSFCTLVTDGIFPPRI